MPCHFGINHCPGKWTWGPDALSRYPGKISSSLTVICKQLSIYNNSNCYHKLSIYNDLALLDKHIVIPCALQKVVPDSFHSTNQGVRGMRFPDLNISNHRKACTDCIRNAPSQQPESLILILSPTYPFEEICVDYFHIEVNSYLCIVKGKIVPINEGKKKCQNLQFKLVKAWAVMFLVWIVSLQTMTAIFLKKERITQLSCKKL